MIKLSNMHLTSDTAVQLLIVATLTLFVGGLVAGLMLPGSHATPVAAGQDEPYNPWLDPKLYSAAEIAEHKRDPDYDNPHYQGRVVPLGNVITVQIINDEGERELIEATFDYLRNGSKG